MQVSTLSYHPSVGIIINDQNQKWLFKSQTRHGAFLPSWQKCKALDHLPEPVPFAPALPRLLPCRGSNPGIGGSNPCAAVGLNPSIGGVGGLNCPGIGVSNRPPGAAAAQCLNPEIVGLNCGIVAPNTSIVGPNPRIGSAEMKPIMVVSNPSAWGTETKPSIVGSNPSIGGAETKPSFGGFERKPGIVGSNPSIGGLNTNIRGSNPSIVGLDTSVGGLNPSFVGSNTSIGGSNPCIGGTEMKPSIRGSNPSIVGSEPSIEGSNPSIRGDETKPIIEGLNPSIVGLDTAIPSPSDKMHAKGSFRACFAELGLVNDRLRVRLKNLKPLSDDDKLRTVSTLLKLTKVTPDQAGKMLLKCGQLGEVEEARMAEVWEFLKEVVSDEDNMISIVTSFPQLLAHNVNEMKKVHEHLVSMGFSPQDLSNVYLKRPRICTSDVEVVRHALDCLMAADVPRKDLVRIMIKAPELFSPAMQEVLKSRVDFFKQIDLVGDSLGKAVVRRPNLLNFNLDSMVYAHQYLMSVMPPADVNKLIRRFGEVLLLDGMTRMEPIVNELLRLGVTRPNVGKILLHRPQLLGFTLTGFEPALRFLIELGVEENMLAKVISKAPQILTMSREEKLIPALEYLHSIGLTDASDIHKLVIRSAHIFCCNMEKNIQPKFNFFLNMGLTKEEVVSMMVLFPSMFGQSIETSLQPKYEYLVNVMKRSPSDIIDFPQYFGYSLEKRIKPRYEKLVARGVHTSLPAMLACVETDFQTRYLIRKPQSPLTPIIQEPA